CARVLGREAEVREQGRRDAEYLDIPDTRLNPWQVGRGDRGQDIDVAADELVELCGGFRNHECLDAVEIGDVRTEMPVGVSLDLEGGGSVDLRREPGTRTDRGCRRVESPGPALRWKDKSDDIVGELVQEDGVARLQLEHDCALVRGGNAVE